MKEEVDGSVIPEQIGPYRIVACLGRGGMGEVFLAWDEARGHQVAIKRVLAGETRRARRERFRREAQAVAMLDHPAIVKIFEVLETREGDCLVMEHVEGATLRQRLADGPLPRLLALRVGRDIAAGLAEAHGKGIVHRDLKAENIIIDPAGRARILDFGLARALWSSDAQSLTDSGALVGTVGYMAPEQVAGAKVDHRADIFVLGVLLYEMLTGCAPFRGVSSIDTLMRISAGQHRPIAEALPDLPQELAGLVETLLAIAPQLRPQDARQVEQELRRYLGSCQAT